MSFFATAAALGTAAATSLAGAAATAIGVGGLSAGAAGVAGTIGSIAGTAIGGGLAGAALGAGTSALTGGDVGKGALMGGVTGLAGGAVGGVAGAAGAGATAAGAVGGAAGGAAGAAAGGEDPLKGALIGGALGGVGGAMAPDAGAVSGIKQVGDLTTNPTTSALQSQASGASSPLIQGANTPTSTASMLKGIATPSTATQYANLPASDMSGITQPSSSSYLQKGIDMVKEHPGGAMQVAGLGLGMLGSPQQQQAQQAQTINTTDYLSPDFQRYQATPNYAEGGLLGGLPGAGIVKGIYNAGIGGSVAPGINGALFGKDDNGMAQAQTPQQPAQQPTQGPMNPIVARAMAEQQAKMQQQSAQPQQPQVQQPQVQPTQTIQAQPQMQAIPIQQAPMREMAPMDSPRIKEMLAQQNQVQQQLQQNPMREMASMDSPRVKEMLAQQNQVQQKLQQTPMREMGMAGGGIVDGYNLGGYAHGGIPRLLSGVGDGVDDQIPATIGVDGKQPARLANNEFVIPARAVSELGNGSSEAGGKMLQNMVDRIQARRSKTIGKGKIAVNSKAVKDLPA